MGVVDFADYVKTIIQAGSTVEGNVVKVIADNGDEIGDAVFKVVQGGNGAASEVGVAVKTGASGATATGLAFLTVDVGVAGAAIAPALGLIAGVSIYEIVSGDSEFHERLINALVASGNTIGRKVVAYWNGDNFFLSEEVIEIYKDLLYEFGALANPHEVSSEDFSDIPVLNNTFQLTASQNEFPALNTQGVIQNFNIPSGDNYQSIAFFPRSDTLPYSPAYIDYVLSSRSALSGGDAYEHNGLIAYYSRGTSAWSTGVQEFLFPVNPTTLASAQSTYARELAWIMLYGNMDENQYAQENAKMPTDEDFPLTYPNWLPYEYPVTVPDPSDLPVVYPIKYPGTEPDPEPVQYPAQHPDPEPAPDIIPEILPDFDLPDPNPAPEPSPEPDPDPQPDPDPIPDTPDPTPAPDPTDPNPDPSPSPAVPVPGLPATVSSNKLFTVYNPSSSELNSLGAYLWDGSIIAAIRDIWQEPLDGIISLIQVYATPATSGSHNIILGFLDSGVSSAVVSNQFTTINCGTVTVPENKKNATDYAPYTSLHLFLPFVGIVELDTNECMGSSITVTYKIDVYTGTCLATVSVTRSADMPNDPILYTYSGNCSQQIPLTSGNATGMLSALIGGITAGLSVASGGGLGVLAGASIAGQSLTHEMFHVNHSGNLSANAGIMGNKKPYLIIGRRHGYDANNYNSYYGFPANKTVNLGNHSGYVKVKKCFLKTSATQPEHNMIMELLTNGVIL